MVSAGMGGEDQPPGLLSGLGTAGVGVVESGMSRAVKYRNKAEEVRVVSEGVRDLGVKPLL